MDFKRITSGLIVAVALAIILLIPNNIIGVHPNDNTASIWLKTTDLINILKDNNVTVNIIKL